MRHGKYPFIIGFLAVPVALYVTFVVAAYLQTFYLSVHQWSGFGPMKYIGFDNFTKMWNDDLFWKSIGNNLYLLIAMPIVAGSDTGALPHQPPSARSMAFVSVVSPGWMGPVLRHRNIPVRSTRKVAGTPTRRNCVETCSSGSCQTG